MQLRNPVQAVARVLLFNAPVDAQLIVTRRCNLSCGYCAEYDNSSEPVPLEELRRRIDSLHRLRSANITLLGGEPLMHPDIAEIVAYAGRRANTSIVTNGFLLRNGIVEKLNEAGLNNLTVSVDTLHADPSRYIQKSLRSLRTKLERLKRVARFDIHVTAVLCEGSKDSFEEFVHEVNALGLRMSLNLIHDGSGQVSISGQRYRDLYEYFYRNGRPFTYLDYAYNKRLLAGETPSWKCRAGSRYLYVDEFGMVQLCASQMVEGAKPLEEYTVEDMRERSKFYKGCEDGCSVGCAYRCSMVDNDKPELVRAILKGFVKGTLSNNGRRPRQPANVEGKEAVDVPGVTE
jgi:MoaA/NifB/PqqE/SkfB family radical SAM enzyme